MPERRDFGSRDQRNGLRRHGRSPRPRDREQQRKERSGQDGGTLRIAAPFYVGTNLQDAPPGHRYLLYLPFWKNDWSVISSGKQITLKNISALPRHAAEIMRHLSARQLNIGTAIKAEIFQAISISPFATGLGWEHPNENGFAFMMPYGIPYLAGSGVKGVVRRAAEELAKGVMGDTNGWDQSAITELFGLEPLLGSEAAVRGALRFFDVVPEIAGDTMQVDIMNPHYGDYYQGKDNATPHDAGQPIPIFFLTVPVGSRFNFVVDCPRAYNLPDSLRERWRELIRAAFEHAFAWLGFGAKTAVGYGQFKANIADAATWE